MASTEPLLDSAQEVGDTTKQDNLFNAAWILEDALEGHVCDSYPSGHAGSHLRGMLNELYHAQSRLSLSMALFMLLLLFEPPLWCQNSADQFSFIPGEQRCPLPDGTKPEMMGLPMLPPVVSLAIEFIALCIATEALLHEANLYGAAKHYKCEAIRQTNAIPEPFVKVAVVMWLDLVIYAFLRQSSFRFAPYGRLILLFYWPQVRDVFAAAVNCIDEFCNVLLFILMSIPLFGWFFIQVLDTYRDRLGETDLSKIDPSGEFGSFTASLLTLWEMQTGANYPDDMVPLFTKMRWVAGIVYPYMIVVFFLFTNLMLAVVYNEYTNQAGQKIESFFKNRVKGVCKAFKMLSTENAEGEKVITMETFGLVCDQLRLFPKFAKQITEENEAIIFAAIDDDGSGQLSLKEFLDACDYLQMTYTVSPTQSYLEKNGYMCVLDVLNEFQVRDLVNSGILDKTMALIIFLNVFFIGRCTWYDYGNDHTAPKMSYWSPYPELFFLLVYPVEVFCRLSVTSWGKFKSDGVNKYNFWTSILLLLAAIITQFPALGGWPLVIQVLPILNMFRIIKVFMLLKHSEAFRVMIACMGRLVAVSGDMITLLFVTLAGFAVVALQAYGGKLYPTNPLLKDSDYLAAPYDVFNFNDMMGCLLSLFNMMVNSWMPEYVDAMGRVSPVYACGWIYGFLFFSIAVSISFNIFTAFLIDIFCSIQEELSSGEQSQDDKNLVTMRQKLADDGFFLHVYIPPAVLKSRTMLAVLDLGSVLEEAEEDAADGTMGDEGEGEEEAAQEEEAPPVKVHPEILETGKHFDFDHAAWVLEDALQGHVHAHYPKKEHAKEMREQMNDMHIGKKYYHWATCILLLLFLFESPLWCQNDVNDTSWLSSAERCPLPGGHAAETMGLPILPPLLGMIIEAAALWFVMGSLTRGTRMHEALGGINIDLRVPGEKPEFFLNIVWLMWFDLAIYFAIRQQNFRFSPYGRIILLFFWPKVQKVFAATVSCIDEFLHLFVLIVAAILFFAWFTMNVLGEYCEYTGADLKKVGGPEFDTFSHTLYSLYMINTGANMPDQFVPLVTEMRWTALIFYIFLLFTFFLFTQLMLAIVYNEYQGTTADQLKTYYINRVKGAAKAFKCIAHENVEGDKVIKKENFHALCERLRFFPNFGHIKHETSDIVFATLDDDKSGQLSLSEFFDACEMLQMTFWTAPTESGLAKMYYLHGEYYQELVSSGKLSKVMSKILLANAAYIAVLSWYDFNDIPDPAWMTPLTFFFSVVYMAEVLVLLLATSWEDYWADGKNQWNFVISILLFASGLAMFVPSLKTDVRDISPFLNAVRVLRLMEILVKLQHFKVMCKCINQLIKVSGDMAILLFVTLAIFAVFGIQQFGGLLTPHNPLLAGSDYLAAPYNIFNFNDMLGSFLTLFNMMVASYMPEYADAMNRVGFVGWAGWFYCSVFFFFGVNISFNVFASFLIDIFVSLQETATEGEGEEEDKAIAHMREQLAEQGLNLHMYIPPEVLKARVMADVIDDLDEIIEQAEDDTEEAAEGGEEKAAKEETVENGNSPVMSDASPAPSKKDALAEKVALAEKAAAAQKMGQMTEKLARLEKELGEERSKSRNTAVGTEKQLLEERNKAKRQMQQLTEENNNIREQLALAQQERNLNQRTTDLVEQFKEENKTIRGQLAEAQRQLGMSEQGAKLLEEFTALAEKCSDKLTEVTYNPKIGDSAQSALQDAKYQRQLADLEASRAEDRDLLKAELATERARNDRLQNQLEQARSTPKSTGSPVSPASAEKSPASSPVRPIIPPRSPASRRFEDPERKADVHPEALQNLQQRFPRVPEGDIMAVMQKYNYHAGKAGSELARMGY